MISALFLLLQLLTIKRQKNEVKRKPWNKGPFSTFPLARPPVNVEYCTAESFLKFQFFVLTNVFQLSFLKHSTTHRITKRRFLSSVILLFIKENSFSFQFSVVKLSQFDICLNLISFLLRILQETTGIFYYSNWFSCETHPLSSTYIVYPFLRFSYIVWGEFSI